MPDILTGADPISGSRLSWQETKVIKNCYRGAVAPVDAVAGVLWQDSGDDSFWQYDGAVWNRPNIEVGDWTPAITFGGAAVGVTYGANNAGRYVRIGDWVFLTGRLQLTSKGTSVGGVLITPLPFTCKNVDGAWSPSNHKLNLITFADQWTGFITANTVDITMGEQTMAGVYSDLTNVDFANNSVVIISAHYEIET